MADLDQQVSAGQDSVSVLLSIAQQVGLIAGSVINTEPAASTTTSPRAIGFNNISTAATAVLGTSTVRHGVVFHNPGTASVYVYPTAIATAPTATTVGGSFVIYPGGTLAFPSPLFPNVTCAWSGLVATGSAQALTVVEFF